MTDQSLIRSHGATQVPTPRDNMAGYIAARIEYQRRRAASTEFQGEHDHAIAEIARYQRLSQMIGGAA